MTSSPRPSPRRTPAPGWPSPRARQWRRRPPASRPAAAAEAAAVEPFGAASNTGRRGIVYGGDGGSGQAQQQCRTAAGPPPAWRTTNTKAGTDSHGPPCPGFGAAGEIDGKMKPTMGFSLGCYFTRAHKPHPSHTSALTCKSPLHTSHLHTNTAPSLLLLQDQTSSRVGGDGTACNEDGPRAHSSPRRPPRAQRLRAPRRTNPLRG